LAAHRTLTGKKMELPVRKLLLGYPLEKIASQDAMANPDSLSFFIQLGSALPALPLNSTGCRVRLPATS
jgi:acetoacetyl-CoA synthetase